ncbi:MAG: hypothetical protein J0M12_13130 [Deltaproteobacteria bacterium]|nr:hypothetical protein [Deltaproteobacteria bacterium]
MWRTSSVCLIAIFFFVARAAADVLPEDYEHLVGNYNLIGQKPDSSETYSGTVRLVATSSGLRLERSIAGKNSAGIGHYELKTPDKIPVLTLLFTESKQSFSSTCHVSSDLDNYARLTCLYGVTGKTRQPGMEAFFIRRER